MPTYNRRLFVGQAIEYFLRQDYPEKELLVLDDGEDRVADLIPPDERIRYIRIDHKLPLGEKRNLACEASRGELIAHWDDDDWIGANRLSHQVRHLHASNALACGLSELLYYRPYDGDAWYYACSDPFFPCLAGGTLLYRRSAWDAARFPLINRGEDNMFLRLLPRDRVEALKDADWYVGIIHGGNTSAKNMADPRWQRRSLSEASQRIGADRPFYVALRNGQSFPVRPAQPVIRFTAADHRRETPALAAPFPHPQPPARSLPLISCIMPTYNRRRFVPQAIKYFLKQDYPERELIIIDDGSDPVGDLIPKAQRITYIRLPERRTIGEKRNLGCKIAQGEIIILWDDDDWYASNRISYQVAPLLENRADLTGLDRSLLVTLDSGQFWACSAALHERMFLYQVVGGSMAFWKSWWSPESLFPDTSLAEDALFLRMIVQRGARLERLANKNIFIYVRHQSNSWQFTPGLFLDSHGWETVDKPSFLPDEDFQFYFPRRTA